MTDECACGHKREDHGDHSWFTGCSECETYDASICPGFITPALRDAWADECAKRAAYIEALVASRKHVHDAVCDSDGCQEGRKVGQRWLDFERAASAAIEAEIEARA